MTNNKPSNAVDDDGGNIDRVPSSDNNNTFKKKNEDDLLLESFLQEVEALTISHNHNNNEKTHKNELDKNKENTDETTPPQQQNQNHQKESAAEDNSNTNNQGKNSDERRNIYKHAEEKRSAWIDFNVENKSLENETSQDPGPKDEKERKTISFAIPTNKKALRKKKNKKKQKEKVAEDDENRAGAGSERSVTSMTPILDVPPPPPSVIAGAPAARGGEGPPLWTAVLDTCALLEQCNYVADIFSMAREASAAAATNNLPQNTSLSIHRAQVSMIEPIQVVVPYIVWSELDGLSKGGRAANNSSNIEENISYRARRAIRMLQSELQQEQQIQSLRQHHHQSHVATPVVIRPETLQEMQNSSTKFLAENNTVDRPENVNDDRILACAIALRDQSSHHQPNLGANETSLSVTNAGGVILLSMDNNLKCKSYANGVTPYEPYEFCLLYQRRMNARKDLQRQNLVNEALRHG